MKAKTSDLIHLLTPAGEALMAQGREVIPWGNAYPRPHLRREDWLCLNGSWHLTVEGEVSYEGEVTVPFPPESLLSGVCRSMGTHPGLTYCRAFTMPHAWAGKRVLLHIGAVDQIAAVVVNDCEFPTHEGGYDVFSLDITDSLQAENVLEVLVEDCLEDHRLPYGKQCEKRGGMWYTPVSGIWQTVWLEAVPQTYVKDLTVKIQDAHTAIIAAEGVDSGEVVVTTPDGAMTVPMQDGVATVTVEHPRLWSPEDPYLYEFTLTAGEDTVRSYFALRTLETKVVDGIPRLCLNGSPYFFHGLLDQGYFSDGIYTPASPECYAEDILAMKALGFNTLRKHIKVEPEQFYYDCDRLGMIVFQDMVNNGDYSFFRDTALPTVGMKRLSDQRMHRDPATRAAFREGMAQTVRRLSFHPSVCYWTIFNEGWGQFESETMYHELKAMDDTRFIDTASGWFAGATSDVESLHVYFKPVKLTKKDKKSGRPIVLSEFGGYAYKPKGHVFNPVNTYGYRRYDDQAAFADALEKLYREEIIPLIPQGLCATVYTQVSDVEDETNGLLSYDRRVCKVDRERMLAIAKDLKL